MKAITVKSIPDDLYERLKQRAIENRRSINSEIIVCIEQAVQGRKQESIEYILDEARETRNRTSGHLITVDEFSRMKTVSRE
ncbi:MAG: Arc family DNA-binding protein [Planctomycetota bacterium]